LKAPQAGANMTAMSVTGPVGDRAEMPLPEPTGSSMRGVPLLLTALVAVLKRLQVGSIDVAIPDGRVFRFAGPEPGPAARIEIRRPRMAWRLVLGGSVGFGASYIDGDWDSPDVAAVLTVASLNEDHLGNVHAGARAITAIRRVWHRFNDNTRRGSRRNIAAHYDLGNAFYARWLDPTMTYSSAVFEHPEQDLAAAQTAKYRRLAEKLALNRDERVLEIGCGWGGFAEFAAKEYGARVTAITLSNEQLAFARQRIQTSGLGERVEAKLIDYRDVVGRFDKIASIEMFEAVGERHWPDYFAKLREALVPGGRAALQIITIADRWFDSYRNGVDYIQRYIFPGGMLPSMEKLREHFARAGLALDRQEFFGQDYAKTLAAWRARFLAAWPDIERMNFDDHFRRMWEFYLGYCEAGFRSGSIDVVQAGLVRR
jgi:cyclopropane-fatty-acyl-phospholipid synthase